MIGIGQRQRREPFAPIFTAPVRAAGFRFGTIGRDHRLDVLRQNPMRDAQVEFLAQPPLMRTDSGAAGVNTSFTPVSFANTGVVMPTVKSVASNGKSCSVLVLH